MPPKGKKAAGGTKEVDEREDPLRAVILTDSFEIRFAPFTLEKPRCLLPLCNIPLIEHTLEFLANSGVQKVYVHCGAHTDQVEEYIRQSKWDRAGSPFKLPVEIIRSTSKSIGDAMRDLDSNGIMTGDFVIVYGDVVSNLPLAPALAAHRSRRATDKNAIMTMVLREAGIAHRTKAQGSSPVFVMDPSKDRCLHYEQISREGNRYVDLDEELFTSHQEIEVRHDLIDCGIDICTPDVLALWSDNFDYEAPRRNFLHSVLKDYELNGKTIHTHIIKDHYAARVRNLHSYDSVSKDIISRWAFPMSPDSNLQEGQTYRFKRGNVYEEREVEKAWDCTVGPRCVVGRGTKIGKRTVIRNSVIGRSCQIGDDCIIKNSYLWEGAVIGDGSEVRNAIIAEGAVIGKSCRILDGALISYGVKISDASIVANRQRITKAAHPPSQPIAPKIVGVDGVGSEYVPSDSEDNDTKAGLAGSIYHLPGRSLSSESISTLHSEASSDEVPIHHARSAGSFLSVTSDDTHGATHQVDSFHIDATSSIYDGLREGTDPSTIQLELQGLRMSINASEHQVRRAVAFALIKYVADPSHTGKLSVNQLLENYQMLFERIMFDKDHSEKADQVDFLLLLQKELAARREQGLESVLVNIANMLYMKDVLEEDGLVQWWEDERSLVGDGMSLVRATMEKFMAVLMEVEEELDSDEEDEDEDEDEDDDDAE